MIGTLTFAVPARINLDEVKTALSGEVAKYLIILANGETLVLLPGNVLKVIAKNVAKLKWKTGEDLIPIT